MKDVALYRLDVQDPGAPPAELLLMLRRRDGLAKNEDELSAEELKLLREADECLLDNAAAFYDELSKGIDFAKRRHAQEIAAERWWWYLDVLVHLPTPTHSAAAIEAARVAAS